MWFAKAVSPLGPGYLCVGLLALQVVGAAQHGAVHHKTLAVVREDRAGAGNTDDDGRGTTPDDEITPYVGAWLLDRVEGKGKDDLLKYMEFGWMARTAMRSASYGAGKVSMVVKHEHATALQIYTIVPVPMRKDDISLQTLSLGEANPGQDETFGGKISTTVNKQGEELFFHTDFSGKKKDPKVMEWTWKKGPGADEISVESRYGDGVNGPASMIQIYKRDPTRPANWEPSTKEEPSVRKIQRVA